MTEHNGAEPVLCACYSNAHALEIAHKFKAIKDTHDRLMFISRCSGVELVVKGKRYWFEFFGKQITPPDIYIQNSSFAKLLHAYFTYN